MEGQEQNNRLLALNEEAQGVLLRACEMHGVDYEELQKLMANLYSLCVYTVEQIKSAFTLLRSAVAEAITPAVQALSDNLKSLWNPEELFFMVPPHIKHLAYNHPQARVRNKNWNRMWKIRERYMKCHKN